ncbi:MAG: chromosomal replication initiator protein DnaA [Rhodobacterales bacterium]|nr:chromosomal replication initiator protein DnaA [Rhodobacterales bacterium]
MDLTQLWDRLIAAMQERVGRQNTEIWFQNASPIRMDANTLVVQVENRYYADWIRENYLEDLQIEASLALGHPMDLSFQYQGEENIDPVSHATKAPAVQRAIGISEHQTFDSFVIGECNKFAHAAACAVAEKPARAYNPLFIYGSTGLGKTHMMHAIGNHVLRHHAGAKVVYVTAEAFMNEMIQCLRFRRMEDFRAKYRQRATVLLVDDVQFLSGRERTQEEFFHTFNALQSSGRQVVLTSDVVPRDIEKLEPRLRTRFEGGLLADMQAPDRETLLAILYQKIEQEGMSLPMDVADAIATGVAGNIRELEGVVNKLSALHSFYNQPITMEFARKQLPDLFAPVIVQVTVASIIESVARFHNLRSADITGSRRTRTLTTPRHLAMFLARKHTGLSFPELGREFGGRAHSTIQHGVRKVDKESKNNPDLSFKIRLIEQGLNIR